MTARVTGLVFDYYPGGGGELVLALALADEAKDDGTNIRPGIEALVRKTRQSRRTVSRQLSQMVQDGWLQVVQAAHGRGESSFVEYRIDPAWMAKRAGDRPITEDATDKPVRNLTGQIDMSNWHINFGDAGLIGQNDMSNCHINAEKSSLTGQIDTSNAVVGGGKGGVFPNDVVLINNLVRDSEKPLGELASEDERLARWMLGLIRKNVNADHAEPRNWQRWFEDVRLMRERDKRTHRQIAELFAWANADQFWKANIRSPGKLREQWDALVSRRNAQGQGMSTPQTAQHSRVCACGCGVKGTKSFRTDGTEWWAPACYDREALRREGASA